MVRERQNGGNGKELNGRRDQLPVLFQVYESAKGNEAKDAAVDAIVGYTFDENFDIRTFWNATLHTSRLYQKYKNRSEHRNPAARVFAGFAERFKQNGVTHKVQQTVDNKVNRGFSVREANELAELLTRPDTNVPEEILEAIDAFAVYDIGDNDVSTYLNSVSQYTPVKRTPENAEQYDRLFGPRGYYQRTIDAIDTIDTIPQGNKTRMLFPEALFREAHGIAVHQVEGIPNVYTTQYGGVSLQEFIENEEHEYDLSYVMHFLSGIPRGDVFWQKFVGATFMTLPHSSIAEGKLDISFTHPELNKRLIEVQSEIANHVITPVFEPVVQNEEFDRLFLQTLKTLDIKRLELLADIVFFGVDNQVIISALFHTDRIAISETSLGQVVCPDIEEFPTLLRPTVLGSRVRNAIKDNYPKITQSIRKRFKEYEHIDAFIHLLDENYSRRENVTDDYIKRVQASSPGILDRAKEKLEALVLSDEPIITSGDDGQGEWRLDMDKHGGEVFVEWRKGNLSNKILPKSIRIYPMIGKPGGFFSLQIDNTQIEVMGTIDVDQNVIFETYDIGHEQIGFTKEYFSRVIKDAYSDSEIHFREMFINDAGVENGNDIPIASDITVENDIEISEQEDVRLVVGEETAKKRSRENGKRRKRYTPEECREFFSQFFHDE